MKSEILSKFIYYLFFCFLSLFVINTGELTDN